MFDAFIQLMNKLIIIGNVINIPAQFKKGNDSFKSLVAKSGYFTFEVEISIPDIADGLRLNPEFIKDWLEWSDDKRTEAGWFFQNNLPGKYVVGYFPPDGKDNTTIFIDKYLACATFIKNEIEGVTLAS